ncbi:MAG: hypothetical protein OCD01_13360 [Fibrobacterales bacterium]
MDLSDREYIEIIVSPGEPGEKSLDALEYALALCLYHSRNYVVVNLQEINQYAIMLLCPLASLITEMQLQGLWISICAPPTIFELEFEELYADTKILLHNNRDAFLTTGASIGITVTDADEALQSTIADYSAHVTPLKKHQEQELIQEPLRSDNLPQNEYHETESDPNNDDSVYKETQEKSPEDKKESPRLLIPEIIDSNVSFSYFDQNKNIEICTLSGEYECTECTAKEYFMKGFPFDSCNTKSCRGSTPSWKLIKKVF